MGNKSSSQEASSDSLISNESSSSSSSRMRSSSMSSATSNSSSQKPSYYQMAKQGYQELVNAIIRPPRCEYSIDHLGPTSFDFCGKTIIRTDFEIINPRGLRVVASLWEPDEASRPHKVLPCVIYMHGNSSSRLEVLPQLSLVLHIGASVLAFDFAGSGKSQGEFVSLGAFEKDDLQCVIEYLRESGKVSTIALWGRSMGAATALLHGERDPSIAGMVLDSAFTDLESLAEELVERGREHGLYAPGFVISIAIRFIRSSVQKAAGFDIKDLAPIAHVDKCYIPALFIAASDDKFVSCNHSKKLHEKYAGDKNIAIVEGDHNSMRPQYMLDSVSIFLQNTLQVPDEWVIENGAKFLGYLPWATQRFRRQSSLSNRKASRSVASTEAPSDFSGPEDMGIGMTQQRQADIQSRIFQMAGQGKDDGKGTAGNVKMSSNDTSHSKMKENFSESGPRDDDSDIPDNIIEDADASWDLTDDQVAELIHQSEIQRERGDCESSDGIRVDWTCDTCTLINSGTTEFCMACGLPKF